MMDEVWGDAESASVNIMTMAWQGAVGTVRTLWDEHAVYVLFDVQDSVLNADSVNAHEQDSVEIFIDENNGKTPYYEADDGQFRVSFENVASYGSNGEKEGFESAVSLTDSGYLVEMKIPVSRVLQGNEVLGFDAQINDSNEKGERISVAKFNDSTDNSSAVHSVLGCTYNFRESRRRDTGTNTDGNTGTNTDGCTGADTDGNTGTDTDGCTGTDTDRNTGTDTDGRTGTDTDGNTRADTDRCARSDRTSKTNANRYSEADTDKHAGESADADSGSNDGKTLRPL